MLTSLLHLAAVQVIVSSPPSKGHASGGGQAVGGLGPGAGSWVVGMAEEHGLSSKALGAYLLPTRLVVVVQVHVQTNFTTRKPRTYSSADLIIGWLTSFLRHSFGSRDGCRPCA